MNELTTQSQIQIQALTEESLKLPQVPIPITDYFGHHLYGREMFVPKDTTITGKVHKFSTIDVLLEGSIMVLSNEGVLRQLNAPMVIESPPGLSKAGHTLTDVRWITFHGTKERDVDEIIAEHVVDTHAQYLEFCGTLPQIEEK